MLSISLWVSYHAFIWWKSFLYFFTRHHRTNIYARNRGRVCWHQKLIFLLFHIMSLDIRSKSNVINKLIKCQMLELYLAKKCSLCFLASNKFSNRATVMSECCKNRMFVTSHYDVWMLAESTQFYEIVAKDLRCQRCESESVAHVFESEPKIQLRKENWVLWKKTHNQHQNSEKKLVALHVWFWLQMHNCFERFVIRM